MDDIKSDIEWKRLFLGIVLMLGGIVTIVIPASNLDKNSIIIIISGIPLILLGDWYFMESMKDIRKAKKEAEGTKDK